MSRMLQKWGERFKDRVFLAAEKEYCESKARPSMHYAGRFAVKEAVTKAFGTGISPHISWLDIQVVRDAVTGAPSVELSPRGRRFADSRNVAEILVSLSHTRDYTVAHALLVGGAECASRGKGPEPGDP